ncbi:hypothetical protein IAT38_005467 [Cryptococcus sp. DSM 104549]
MCYAYPHVLSPGAPASHPPGLHLDFNSPASPPPTYSPHTYTTSSPTAISFSPPLPGSPSSSGFNFQSSPYALPSPRRSYSGGSRRGSEESVASGSASGSERGEKSGSPQRIVMGAMVKEDFEEESLEVPGIVLTEPSHPSPRPSPPPKQTVLLAPTSLPLPPSPPHGHSTTSSISAKAGHQFSPAFLSFLHNPSLARGPAPPASSGWTSARTRARAVVLVGVVVLGGWHLWSSLQVEGWGGLVEDALEVV